MFDAAGAVFAVFPVIFGVVGFLVLAGFIFVVVSIVRNAQKVSASGHDPITLESELAVKVADSQLLTPAKTLEQRLAELDDLHRRGILSDDEYHRGRDAAIAGN